MKVSRFPAFGKFEFNLIVNAVEKTYNDISSKEQMDLIMTLNDLEEIIFIEISEVEN